MIKDYIDIAIKVLVVVLAFIVIYQHQKLKQSIKLTDLALRDEDTDEQFCFENAEELILFVSSLLYDMREKSKVLEDWEADYTLLVNEYGSVHNFYRAFESDFDILRKFILDMYTSYFTLRQVLDNLVSTKKITDIKVELASLVVSLDKNLETIESFITEEEKAHEDVTTIPKKIKKIKKMYKSLRGE